MTDGLGGNGYRAFRSLRLLKAVLPVEGAEGRTPLQPGYRMLIWTQNRFFVQCVQKGLIRARGPCVEILMTRLMLGE